VQKTLTAEDAGDAKEKQGEINPWEKKNLITNEAQLANKAIRQSEERSKAFHPQPFFQREKGDFALSLRERVALRAG
jgi:hypothetical protein